MLCCGVLWLRWVCGVGWVGVGVGVGGRYAHWDVYELRGSYDWARFDAVSRAHCASRFADVWYVLRCAVLVPCCAVLCDEM